MMAHVGIGAGGKCGDGIVKGTVCRGGSGETVERMEHKQWRAAPEQKMW